MTHELPDGLLNSARRGRLTKRPMTRRAAALGGLLYAALGGWLLAIDRLTALAWILLASALIALIAAWDPWRNRKR